MPASLNSFIEAASDAIAREIAGLRREAQREKELRDAEHRALLAELRLSAAELHRQVEARLETLKDGAPGRDGINGIDGKDGADGKDGIDGKDGSPGLDGKDGERGPPGADGKDGLDGANGTDGKDGQPGLNGKDGDPGLNGADGKDGIAGKDGLDGADGKDGKDSDPGMLDALKSAHDALFGEVVSLRESLAELQTARADNDLNDKEFDRRVEEALAGSHMLTEQHVSRAGAFSAFGMALDNVVGAMREAPAPIVNVTVPITMPKRGKEIMTVEHDEHGRIKRSIKQEVD